MKLKAKNFVLNKRGCLLARQYQGIRHEKKRDCQLLNVLSSSRSNRFSFFDVCPAEVTRS